MNQLKDYIAFLEALLTLETPIYSKHNEELEAKTVGDGDAKSKKKSDEINNGFLFERNLKGGYIPQLDTYVPEKVIRNLELTHGDRVKALPKKGAHFHFELIQKGEGDNPNRAEIKYCIIEKDGDLWVCNRTLSGESIHINDLPYTVHLKASEIKDFHLKEGDIVDIAYIVDNPNICKVVWKHDIEDDQYSSPLPSGSYKDKSKSNHFKREEHPKLKGKTLTLIGAINRFSTYRDRLSALGARVQAMDGNEDEKRIAALIRRSDLVFIIIPAVSHNGSTLAKKYCKLYNIRFSTIDTIGVSTVVSTAIDQAKRIESLF
ncbi:DUF2325 domain-containing protein [Tuberibacillus sp. Marseille-P3662]|uniref:DUF2325 domain-containing protein n=1 Tax=Tuberibacillus sp. Marseille-P3662 TaxID=1965358 RepID=UPI000A1C9B57|nr:DUF2325 domain-containing protein [Tuberibacillus sp. Marseille-P3662]